jgi:hypothetical protein
MLETRHLIWLRIRHELGPDIPRPPVGRGFLVTYEPAWHRWHVTLPGLIPTIVTDDAGDIVTFPRFRRFVLEETGLDLAPVDPAEWCRIARRATTDGER